MEEFLVSVDHWSWWTLALLMFVIELAMPGVIFLWLAIAATLTGALVWIMPDLGWQVSFVIFAVLSVISIVVGRKVWRPGHVESEDPTLNRRAEQYVGQTFTLDTALENGRGRLNVGDSSWLVSGPDLPAGAKVKVIGVDGSVLEVEQT
ncbi:MAG: NfeD family protein [Rhodospirillaceae bacterium]|jgi:membrane protein implicated in regulation of membrane protease activity